MNVKRNLTFLLGLLVALTMLSGCGYMRSKFGSKSEVYKVGAQSKPLEVPPDLDAPNRTGTLVIPEPSPTAAPAAADTSVPVASISDQAAPPITAAPSLGGEGMTVADTPASTWNRVGLALERSGVATIEKRDEKTRTYEVLTNGSTTKSPGWLKKTVTLGMADDKKVLTPVRLRIRVSGTGSESRVTVEGATSEAATSAARNILATLGQRLS
ncbi:hypothetical protein [Dokdonella sp.]|uniref:hypothetical protein n=1 Tax=Dokdonella sp. TaxID=2291710 RepID=UPI003C503FF5